MLFLTAYNSAFSELGELCAKSIQRHIERIGKHHMAVERIPDDYDRKASWFKLDAIRKHLSDHDYVAWIDADAMMLGDFDLRAWVAPVPLNICFDLNGANNGVAVWKKCRKSMCALDLMDKMYPVHKDGPWFEQHGLHDFIDILEHHALPKEIWNAYPSDRTVQTQILHLPGMRNEDRLPIMIEEAKRLGI